MIEFNVTKLPKSCPSDKLIKSDSNFKTNHSGAQIMENDKLKHEEEQTLLKVDSQMMFEEK